MKISALVPKRTRGMIRGTVRPIWNQAQPIEKYPAFQEIGLSAKQKINRGERGAPSLKDRAIPPPYPMGTAIFLGRSFQGRVLTVGTTAVLLIRSQFSWPYIIMDTDPATDLYIGNDSDVNTTSGFPILHATDRTFVVGEGVEVWGISTGNINVRVFQL